MNNYNFKPAKFLQENIGVGIKSSSKRFMWTIEMDDREFVVELLCYYVSNKRAINVNSNQVFFGKKPLFQEFSHTFNMNKHVITVHNSKTLTDLIVDSVSFEKLYIMKISNRMYGQVEEIKGHNFEPIASNALPEYKNSGSLDELFENKPKTSSPSIVAEKKSENRLNLLEQYSNPEDIGDNFPVLSENQDKTPEEVRENTDKNRDFNILFR